MNAMGTPDEPSPATAPNPVAGMSWKTRLTWPVRFRLLRWLDRPLARLLGCQPRMLSSRVEVQQVPFRGNLHDRACAWLWSRRTVGWAIGSGAIVATTVVAAGSLIGLLPSVPQPGTEVAHALVTTLAAVLGGLFGVLQTIVVFAVQLRSPQNALARPLTPLVARRYYSFFILGGIAGATVAYLLALTIAALGYCPILGGVSALSAVVVPTAFGFALWLLAKIIAESSAGDMKVALPVLTEAMRIRANGDRKIEARRVEFRRFLSAAGAAYMPFLFSRAPGPETSRSRVDLPGMGVVADLDCYRFLRATGAVRRALPDTRISVQVAPGDLPPHDAAVVLSADGAGPAVNGAARTPSAPALKQFRASFFVTAALPVLEDDTDAFLKGMEAALTTLARDRRHSEFESHLRDFEKLWDGWIDVIPPNLLPPDGLRFSDTTPRFAGPLEIDLYEVSLVAIRSNDPNIVVGFESALLRCGFTCLRREQPWLGQRFLDHILYLYRAGAQQPELASALEARLDSAIFTLLGRPRNDAEPDWIAIRFTLALAHEGIRFGRTQGALNAVGRLLGEEPRPPQGWPFPLKRDQQSLRGYLAIVLTGWALHVMRSPSVGDSARATAEAVLLLLLQHVPKDPAVLLAIWELYRGHGGVGSDVDRRLGIDRWDPQEWALEYRVGIPATYWLDTSWGQLGLRAALLGAGERFTANERARFATPASPSFWDPKKERDALQDPELTTALDIPAEVIPARVQAAMEIIEQRAEAARQHHADSIRKAELSEARVAQFRAAALEAFGKSLRWHAALADRGLGPIAPAAELPTVTQRAMRIPKDCLVDCEVCCVGLADHLGEVGARVCGMQLVHAVERGSVASSATLERLGHLQDRLQAARREMVTAGFEPNVVILPDAERFAAALFDKPIWQVEGHGRFDGVVLGIWEGLTVLRCPYIYSSSALMIDTTKLLTKLRAPDEPDAVTISFKERDEGAAPEPAAKAERDTPSSPSDMRVLVTLEAKPLIGIANPEAARRIDLAQSDGAYRLDEEQKIYHRPNCSEIGERPLKPQVWLPREMKPCSKCHPDRWDFEARWGAALKA